MKKPAKKNTPVKRKYTCKAVEILRWQRFAHKYIELNYNGTQAYLAVYGEDYELKNNRKMTDKVASTAASRLLSKVKVQDIIEECVTDLVAQERISAGKVLSRYDKWADSNIKDIVNVKTVTKTDEDGNRYECSELTIKDFDNLPDEIAKNIESITQTKEGIKITLVSKKASNDMLAKYLKLDKGDDEDKGTVINMYFDEIDAAL